MENSYSNSNNGGSVNSQESLWQMKMAAGNSQNLVPQHGYDHQSQLQPTYGYDPMTHGGYGAIDDYAPYPHLTTTSSQHGDEYHHNMRNSQNPSRQEYCSDPYAAVHKPKKRMDQHLGEFKERKRRFLSSNIYRLICFVRLDSPYHDVSGLPDPYLEQMPMDHEDSSKAIPPHMSLSYEDNLGSGYSTPNSRNRRVIKEIIV